MDIVTALKQEETKLNWQLNAVREAIAVLNGGSNTLSAQRHKLSSPGKTRKRTMSAAVRARISRTAKARWAKIRAEKVAGKKSK